MVENVYIRLFDLKNYLQKQIWLPAANEEGKKKEKKLLTIVMRRFEMEGKKCCLKWGWGQSQPSYFKGMFLFSQKRT